MLERLRPLLSRRVLRAVAIAAATLFIASAVLLPKKNPATRDWVLAREGAGQVWGELVQWRVSLMQYAGEYREWPSKLQLYAPDVARPVLRVTSPAPYELQVDVLPLPELGKLAGTQMLLRLTPGTTTWTCRAGRPPVPPGYLPMDCPENGAEPAPPPDPLAWLRSLVLWCGIVFTVCAAIWLLRHPLIRRAQLSPGALRRTPLPRLPEIDRLLRIFGRLPATLQAAEVRSADWRRAVQCAQEGGVALPQALADKVAAKQQAAPYWPLQGVVLEWQFGPDVPISLDRCLVLLPRPGLDDEALVQSLKVAQTGSDVLLVLSTHSAETPCPLLQAHCEDHANLHVMVDSASMTEWLLGPRSLQVLLRLLSSQLRITRISPYQTRGGVTREGLFFGRSQLLARVVTREPANYLVVGGRQLGKSSLLKAVQRRLQGHPQVVCHYVSLRDHRLAPRMALQFGLPAHTALEDIVTHLQAQYEGKRLYLLIDEADLFFRDEAAQGYQQLSTLRSLSDEGRCWFMLAGFWELYAAAVLDYQSPLRNFGEVLTIGGLERTACRELATEPLRRLRLGFAGDTLVDKLIDASGQRANLVAILCQECLEALQPGERAIEARHVAQASASQAVQDALAGWGRLSQDEEACGLDRVVVYHTARQGSAGITLGAVAELMESEGIVTDPQALQQSLARLQLAYVLRRDDAVYRFAIPLLAAQFEPAETEVLLRQELGALRRRETGR